MAAQQNHRFLGSTHQFYASLYLICIKNILKTVYTYNSKNILISATFSYTEQIYLIVCGLRDVNRKWRHISGLPGSSKKIHEVVMKVPYKKADHYIK